MLLRKVILPIALRKVLPSYGNELILMVKATSLVSLTTYMEMTGIARKIMAKTFAPVEAFIAAGILYLFLNFNGSVCQIFRMEVQSSFKS